MLVNKIFKKNYAGLVGAFLYATYIPYLEVNHVIMSEGIYTLLLYSALLFLITGFDVKKGSYFVFSGVLFGLAHLTRPDILYVTILLLIIIIIRFHNYGLIKAGIKNSILFFLFFSMVILPWVIRNYISFNRFILTTTLEGEVLAYDSLSKHALDPALPFEKANIFKQIKDMDEVSKNNALKKHAIEYFIQNPGSWLKNIPDHLLTFWFGNYRGEMKFLYYATTEKHHRLSISALIQNSFLFLASLALFIFRFDKKWFLNKID